jgi:hypothetical protein
MSEDKLEKPPEVKFILDTPLYAEVPCDISDLVSDHYLYDLFFSSLKFDGYCKYCRQYTTYSSDKPAISLNGPGNPENLMKLLIHTGVMKRIVTCARNSTHHISVWFFFKKKVGQDDCDKIIKVGQYPSLADIANDELRIYDRELEKIDRVELHRAVGLAAHGSGIGAFAYLRRVFERLLMRTFETHKDGNGWTVEAWSRSRVEEKIKLLKPYLPEFLHDCGPLYGVLSKGLHELDEEECKVCFSVVKDAILEILDDEKRAREKAQAREKTKKALAKISSELGNGKKP